MTKNRIKKRKAQTSMEFVILTGFMLMAFLTFYMVIQSKLVEANRDATDISAKQIETIVLNEVTMAESVTDGYYREFELPQKINGMDYNVSILSGVGNNSELVVTYTGKERVYFIQQGYIDNRSTVGKGLNNISKIKGVIVLNKKSN